MFGQIFTEIGNAAGSVIGSIADTTSKIVKSGGATSPAGFAVNTAIGAIAGGSEPSVTAVADTAVQGKTAVQGSIVGAGSAIKDGAENVINTIGGGIDTVKKYLPAVALGGVALLILSRKR